MFFGFPNEIEDKIFCSMLKFPRLITVCKNLQFRIAPATYKIQGFYKKFGNF